jgi:hypothetical protein
MSSPQLILPQVSLNGTNKQELVSQQLAVVGAIRVLLEAMGEAAPHGRDYQRDPSQLEPAKKAWMDRRMLVYALRKEIEQHAEAIDALPG